MTNHIDEMMPKPNKICSFVHLSKKGTDSSNRNIMKYENKLLLCQWPNLKSQISQFIFQLMSNTCSELI